MRLVTKSKSESRTDALVLKSVVVIRLQVTKG